MKGELTSLWSIFAAHKDLVSLGTVLVGRAEELEEPQHYSNIKRSPIYGTCCLLVLLQNALGKRPLFNDVVIPENMARSPTS